MSQLHPRGLTLIELLAALALLGLLTGALAAWTRTTAQAAATASSKLPWLSAAQAALDRIGEDLAAGDFESNPQHERLIVNDNQLRIETRSAGQVVHQYRLAPEGRLIRLEQRLHPTHGQADQERMLLDRVSQFTCLILGEGDHQTLEVRVVSMDGLQARRSWPWP